EVVTAGGWSAIAHEESGEDEQRAGHDDDQPGAQPRHHERIGRQLTVDDSQLQGGPAREGQEPKSQQADSPLQPNSATKAKADARDHAEGTAGREETAIRDVHAAIGLETREQREPAEPGAEHDRGAAADGGPRDRDVIARWEADSAGARRHRSLPSGPPARAIDTSALRCPPTRLWTDVEEQVGVGPDITGDRVPGRVGRLERTD